MAQRAVPDNDKGASTFGAKMFDNTQKKLLEKMYARVFELSPATKGRPPELTEEGQILLQRTNIKPAELMPKTYDDFLK